ncbi:MAG: hypothetical protein JNK21_02500 [Rhodospirillaceae bacterium]|nr:hypothetical protein [Rhodospirillaceae bacterium]
MHLPQLSHAPDLKPRRHWRWLLIVAALIFSHLALLAHQFEHSTQFAADAGHTDCALCSFASHLSTPPDSAEVAAPLAVAATKFVLPAADSALRALDYRGFNARAPPAFLSA